MFGVSVPSQGIGVLNGGESFDYDTVIMFPALRREEGERILGYDAEWQVFNRFPTLHREVGY